MERFTRLAGIVVPIAGATVLFGWNFNIEPLKRILPGLVAMNPVTALAFILAGIALFLLRPRTLAAEAPVPWHGYRHTGRACAALVMAIGALKLAAVWGPDVGIDQLIFTDRLDHDHPLFPNRMAPNAALNFMLLGCALLLLSSQTRSGRRPAQCLAAISAFVSLLAVIDYAYEVKTFYGLVAYMPMALHTAAAFVVLSIGVFCAHPTKGWMLIFTSESAGGVLMRLMLPTSVIVIVALGWLHLEGERHGIYAAEMGVELHTAAVIVIFSILLAWTARTLHGLDVQRRQVEAEKERFFTLSHDLLCIIGFDGPFKRLNPAWEQVLGYTLEELMAVPFMEFIHPEDQERTLRAVEEVKSGREIEGLENRYRCRDGSYRWFLWSAAPVVENQLIYATARDVTLRKQTDEEIQRLNDDLKSRAAELETINHELESFSYSVSHDLRAPLRHIQGFVELLVGETTGTLSAKSQRYLKIISDAAGDMGSLIDDLLAFARAGRVEMRQSGVDLEQMVRQAIAGLEPQITGRHVVWKNGTLPMIQGDPVLIRQVLVNLISNALKYSRPRDPAQIEIGCAGLDGDGRFILFVRDNGVGFDMQYAGKLFGVFQRLHRADEFEGTGVGLANVNRIITRHGGRVWAEAEPDAGATFFFTLKPFTPPNP